jgi:cobalt-zinc-cadmium efflux system outer membrane protein
VSGWRIVGGLALLVVALALRGCALNQAAQRDLSAALSQYEQRRSGDAELYTRSSPTAAATTEPAANVASTQPNVGARQPQSLRDYIALALAQNPDIRAAEETARSRYARVPQATALPDPMLMTKTLPEPVRTAAGDNYFMLGVQQRLVLPQKLDLAGQVAFQEAHMALEELQRTRLNVIAEVKRTYFRIYIIDRTTEVDRTNQDLLRGLIDAARAQVAAGQRRQDDVLRAQVELSNLESQLIELRQQRETMVAMLNRVLNRTPQTSVPASAEYDLRSVDVRLEELLAPAVRQNPELRRLKERIERDRHAIDLAKLAYWPDVNLGFEWMYLRPREAFVPPPNPQTGMPAPVNRMSESGMDSWAITVGLNLPIWFERIEGAVREARGRLLASQHEYAAAQNRVSFQIADALARVRAQRELAEIFKSTIIPQAQQAYEVSRVAYSTGGSDFLYVIDNWQKWLMFTIQYHRALGELERSVADLEEAVGLSWSELGGGS